MGGSAQIWVRLHLGEQPRAASGEIALGSLSEGSPTKTVSVQLALRRTKELDTRDPSNPKRVLEARKVYWRTRQSDTFNWLGFYYVLPLYDIPIGGEAPHGSRWVWWNEVYYVASSGILVRQK